MTVLRLLRLTSPSDFAAWFETGAEYVRDVTAGMGFDAPDLDAHVAAGTAAMRADRTDVDPDVARFVAADLLADATFAAPFTEWTPLWYELALAGPNAVATRRLTRVGRAYAASAGSVHAPRFSRPGDVFVDGQPAVAGLGAGPRGFARRFVLADAVLHLEWYVHVAREAGVDVPQRLVDRTRRESAAYWGGNRETLSPDVRRFQRLLFADDEWVARIDEAYGLDSALLSVWECVLRRAREDLERDGTGDDGGD